MSQSRWQEHGERGAVEALPMQATKNTAFLRSPVSFLLLVFACIGAVFFAWWGYGFFFQKQEAGEIPFVRGEEGPYKVRPDDPDTHKIPHREKTIYDHLSGQKVEKRQVKMRPLPEALLEEEPTLPVDFIQAFSDDKSDEVEELRGLDGLETFDAKGADLSGGRKASSFFTSSAHQEAPLAHSPFLVEKSPSKVPAAGGDALSPFAEEKAFFDAEAAGDAGKKKSAVETKEGVLITDPVLKKSVHLYPPKVPIVEGVGVAGHERKTSEGFSMSLEIGQTSSEEGAKQLWHRLKRQAPDLLAAQKVVFKKIDHGEEKGFLYHVILEKLSKKRAEELQSALSKRNLYVSQLPN